ncbi:hypothetical protein BIW71_25930, partial [Salmonella enterica]|nr:hypothetical protein [Salmonella enterica]
SWLLSENPSRWLPGYACPYWPVSLPGTPLFSGVKTRQRFPALTCEKSCLMTGQRINTLRINSAGGIDE